MADWSCFMKAMDTINKHFSASVEETACRVLRKYPLLYYDTTNKQVVEIREVYNCDCSISDLMKDGCKCGGR